MRPLLLSGALVWCSGCAFLLDFDGLEGPSTSTDSGPPGDVTADGEAPALDAGDSATPPSRFCAQRGPGVSSCVDFDDDPSLGGWQLQRSLGDAGVSAAQSSSRPGSLELTIPQAASSSADIVIVRTFTDLGARFAVELKVLVLERPAFATAQLLLVGNPDTGRLRLSAGGILVEEPPRPAGVQRSTTPPPVIGAWTRVRVEIDTDGRSGSLLVGTTTTTFPISTSWVTSSMLVQIGLKEVDVTNGAWRVYVDDVLVERL